MLKAMDRRLLSRIRVLGLFLDGERVRATVRMGPRICWCGERPVSAESPELAQLAAILREAPAAFTVRVALDPARAPIRLLEGLPPLPRRGELQRLVRTNASRFFVLRGGQPVPSTVVRMAGGAEWAAAASSSLIELVASCCAAGGRRLELIAPAAAAGAAATGVTEVSVSVAGLPWVATTARRRIVSIARAPATAAGEDPARSADGGSPRAADVSAGATFLRRGTPFVIAVPRSRGRGHRATRRRSVSLALAAVTALAALLFLPGVHALARAREWEQASPRAAATRAQAARMSARLDSLRLVTDRVARFQASRLSMTRQLGRLTEALPESTAILALRLDTLGGSLTTLSTDGPAVLPALGKVPGLTRVRVSGAVTREQVSGVELERVALTFAFAPRGTR